MPFVIGINFRATSGYVTDGTDETYCIGDNYPTTRGGATFGWTSALSDGTRDRNSGIDRRLAGFNSQANNGTQKTFQLDLPQAGDYTIGLAIGEDSFDQIYQYVQVKDNTTTLFTIDDTNGTTAGHFLDANGTDHLTANWPSSQTTRSVTMSSTTLNVIIGSPTSQTNQSTIAHLFVELEEASSSDLLVSATSTIIGVRYRIVGC